MYVLELQTRVLNLHDGPVEPDLSIGPLIVKVLQIGAGQSDAGMLPIECLEDQPCLTGTNPQMLSCQVAMDDRPRHAAAKPGDVVPMRVDSLTPVRDC